MPVTLLRTRPCCGNSGSGSVLGWNLRDRSPNSSASAATEGGSPSSPTGSSLISDALVAVFSESESLVLLSRFGVEAAGKSSFTRSSISGLRVHLPDLDASGSKSPDATDTMTLSSSLRGCASSSREYSTRERSFGFTWPPRRLRVPALKPNFPHHDSMVAFRLWEPMLIERPGDRSVRRPRSSRSQTVQSAVHSLRPDHVPSKPGSGIRNPLEALRP